MVKIIHISDTHIGFNLASDCRSDWKEVQKVQFYEDDFYQAWNGFIEFCISNKDEIDFIVHSGDLFHHPFPKQSRATPEPAREVLMTSLIKLYEQTDIPMIIIGGNHGVYKEFRFSTLDSLFLPFKHVHYCSKWDLIQAIQDKKPLFIDFPEKEIRFFLFPYFDWSQSKLHAQLYNEWITFQEPQKGTINIAVVHGSNIDDTLHGKIERFDYDYIALGHEHNLRKIRNNAWDSGSLVRLNFNELNNKNGFLEVKIPEKGQLKVIPHEIKSPRKFKQFDIQFDSTETNEIILARVNKELDEFHTEWDGSTAARVKIILIGSLPLKQSWKLNQHIEILQRKMLSDNDFNIIQLKIERASKILDDARTPKPKIIEGFILEDPKKELEEFIRLKYAPEMEFDIELLVDQALQTLEDVLKEDEQ